MVSIIVVTTFGAWTVAGFAAGEHARPNPKPTPSSTGTAKPDFPATIPFVPKPEPPPPPKPAPALPAVATQVQAQATPKVYQMYSSRDRVWYTHADPRWLELYVRGRDSGRALYQAGTCTTGTCPR